MLKGFSAESIYVAVMVLGEREQTEWRKFPKIAKMLATKYNIVCIRLPPPS
jgi:hypothetical protein